MEPGPHVQACQRRCVEAMIDHLTAQREDLFWELAEEMYADPTTPSFRIDLSIWARPVRR